MDDHTTQAVAPEVNERTKYEMNLAEFPLALLTTRAPKDLKVLVYEDVITGENGAKVKRRWEVFPHIKYGFPKPSTQSTLFELFQLWSEQQFASQQIHFGTIYDLIKRKGLRQADKQTYQRIRDDLRCLTGISITATNAFWDNSVKAYVSRTFHLFETVDFHYTDPKNPEQSMLPFGNIRASRELWDSMASNAFIALQDVSREAFHGYTPTEQRLALYLAKMLRNKPQHRRNAVKLTEQLPITAKLYKQQKYILSRTCDGLIAKKFPYLTGYRYEVDRRGDGENIIFTRNLKRLKPPAGSTAGRGDDDLQRQVLVADMLEITGDHHSKGFYTMVAAKLRPELIYRAISATRQAHLRGEIKTNRARYFTATVKQLAKEAGVEL